MKAKGSTNTHKSLRYPSLFLFWTFYCVHGMSMKEEEHRSKHMSPSQYLRRTHSEAPCLYCIRSHCIDHWHETRRGRHTVDELIWQRHKGSRHRFSASLIKKCQDREHCQDKQIATQSVKYNVILFLIDGIMWLSLPTYPDAESKKV